MREAFRRLNYAFLTLVGKGDAKPRHPEILIVAAMARSQFKRLVDDGGADNGGRKNAKVVYGCHRARTLLGDKVNFVPVVFLTEDKVPGEVGH